MNLLPVFTAPDLFIAALCFWLVGACGAPVFSKRDRLANHWGNGWAILGALAGLSSSLMVLLGRAPFAFDYSSFLPLLSFTFKVDPLAAFFILIICLIALLASIYALGYVTHYYGKYNLGGLGFFYNIFLAGMVLVVSAHQALLFLVFWEIMSLASYFLVIQENREEKNVRAGSLYFIMTHLGTACILVAFLLLYQKTGTLDFSLMKAHLGAIPPLEKNVIFILALVGFGTKAGIIPFHIWLPSAHPAAPSHVSALMSGVMIKTGIYMLIRLFMDLLPGGPLWWGVVILLLGAASSLLGVLYALTEHDLKRLLAYHSIENIGIILIGLGAALVFSSLRMIPLAILGLTAALFHTLNHATFKSLLFMGAGSVISGTHSRNMEEYGGLIKTMPQTAFFFLIGSLAISALPPFNGFFSEWLTFQSLFVGLMAADASARWVLVLAAGSLAFTGGLAAMCFVKAFGVTFLARPRSQAVIQSRESGFSLRLGMAVLALLTLLLGLAGGWVTQILSGIVTGLADLGSAESAAMATPLTVGLRNDFASLSLPLVLAALVLAMGLTLGAVFSVSGRRKIRIGPTWDCGTTLNSRMEITATGFARSIITIFQALLRPTREVRAENQDETSPYYRKNNRIELGVEDIYRRYLYQPLQALAFEASEYVKRIQSGNINMYILYILGILIALLLAAVV